jgi:hypothetical protein
MSLAGDVIQFDQKQGMTVVEDADMAEPLICIQINNSSSNSLILDFLSSLTE